MSSGFMLRIGLKYYPDNFCNILLLCHPVYFHDARGMCPWHILNYLSPPFALCVFVCIPLCSWCIRVHDGALISSWLGIFSLSSLCTPWLFTYYILIAQTPLKLPRCAATKSSYASDSFHKNEGMEGRDRARWRLVNKVVA